MSNIKTFFNQFKKPKLNQIKKYLKLQSTFTSEIKTLKHLNDTLLNKMNLLTPKSSFCYSWNGTNRPLSNPSFSNDFLYLLSNTKIKMLNK